MLEQDKILLIWDRMGDYHRARWQALSQIAGNERIFAADLGTSDGIYKWPNTENQQDYILLSNNPVNSPDLFLRAKNFISTIKSKSISTICIPGYGRIEYLLFIIISKIYNRKVILFAESWYGKNLLINFIKKKFLNHFCDGFLVSGERAQHHFNQIIRIPKEKIKPGYSVVDNDHFSSTSLISCNNPLILCVARFSDEKNLNFLINAFKKSIISKKYHLRLIGGGPQKGELLELTKNDPEILIDDWIFYEELPKSYHEANIFVLPSIFEPWGLVVNEAMAAGLPIIISNQCGCVPDLISSKNGFTFDPANEADLIKVLDEVAAMTSDQLEEMGRESQKIIKNYSPESWAQNLIKLISV